MTTTPSNPENFNPEDLMNPDFWRSMGIEPVIVESEEDLNKVTNRIQQEVQQIQQNEGNQDASN